MKMKFHNKISSQKLTGWYVSATLLLSVVGCTDDKFTSDPDYTVVGKEITVNIPIDFPQMDVRTRADMTNEDLNRVSSLWVATFSATTHRMTSNGWHKTYNLNTTDVEIPHSISISTLSGPSYIVAVANVSSTMAVTLNDSDDPTLTPQSLSNLLTDYMSWEDFLKIGVVSPSTQDLVNAPNPPLTMTGAYTESIDVDESHDSYLSKWQTDNFNYYTIPYKESGNVTLEGAIHMRRLVSQVTFNLIPGQTKIQTETEGTNTVAMKITPYSYRVINVPKFSWLFERAESADNDKNISNYGTNFADNYCTKDNCTDYYWSTAEYTSNNILSSENGSYTFNFWQGENKHTARTEISQYVERDKVGEGNGLFTALTGSTWTSNNMASYVLISCNVEYEDPINVNDKGEIKSEGTEVQRTGDATFLVHLGYMNNEAADFNCYRNTQYTYNLTINGVDDIRVEAYNETETPGVSGIVADVEGGFLSLDCHYNTYNIQLSETELTKYDETKNSGFGFLITTYDSGVEKTYTEENFIDSSFDDLSDTDKQYVDWVELRKTTSKDVLASYTPRTKDSETFNLVDASKGIKDSQKSESGWYTVFVREYTYEAANADESKYVNGKPIWHRYVFQNPRRFYIRTTKAVSSDGKSLYTRAKYVGIQKSIMSYYDRDAIPESTETDKVKGSAIGVEYVNESFGLNLCESDCGNNANNGRYNCWSVLANGEWDNYLDLDKQQEIKENESNGINAAIWPLPQISPFYESVPSDLKGASYFPQPNSIDKNDYIGAIYACLNRNRDNNGDGIINMDEMRWYIPAMGKYLRMIIGQDAFAPNQLVNFETMPDRPVSSNDYWGEYFFYGSEGRVLWAMEGLSTSNYFQYVQVNPWQVRCIRNLGTNLGTISENDPTIPAYSYISVNSEQVSGRVEMSYYQSTTMRTTAYDGNGTNAGQMPVHTISQTYNSLYRYGFEIHNPGNGGSTDGTITAVETNTGGENPTYIQGWDNLITYINTNPNNLNPCTELGDRWRLPNVKELAIMRNLSLINGSDRILSCSVGVITANGKKINNPTEQRTTDGKEYNPNNSNGNGNGNQHYFMNAVDNNITQGWISSYGIRCVRDYIPTGN